MATTDLKKSLDAPRGNLFFLNPDDLVLVTDEKDPLYDERVNMPLAESMVRSVKVRGVIEPIVVRKDGGRVVVVDGRQRVRAAVEANKRIEAEGGEPIRVPAIVKRTDDVEAASVMVLLNEIRFSDSLMTKAKKAKRLVDLGRSEEELAEIFGVTKSTVTGWLTLIDLSPKVQAAVEGGTVTLTDAVRTLSKLPRAEQPDALEKLVEARPTRKTKTEAKANGAKVARTVSPVARLKKLSKFMDEHCASIGVPCATLVGWLEGDVGDKELAEVFGALAPMFKAKAKAKGKTKAKE